MVFLSELIVVVSFLSLFVWIGLLIYHRGNPMRILETVFTSAEHSTSHWRLSDAMVAFGLLQVLASIGIGVLQQRGLFTFPSKDSPLSDVQQHQSFIWMLVATLVAQLVAAAVVIGWAVFRNRSASHLSLNFRPSDLTDGVKATVLFLPPVLLISGLVNHFIPYRHVVLELLKSTEAPGELILVFFTTAIVTPFVEELIFRVLLISGLENLASTLSRSASTESASTENLSTENGPLEIMADRTSPPWWPVLVSSFLFAILHVNQGGAPIPLFFLAVGLGVLFRQTRRIWPVMIVHMALNTLTLVATVLQPSSPV